MSESLRVGLVGGTGLGEMLGAGGVEGGQRHEMDTPFGRPSDAIIEGAWAGVPVLLLARHGPGHLLNPSQVPYRANIFALKQLGCTHILASGAVGSLREEFKPKQLVIPDQVIDRTCRRANTFFEHAAVHVEFAEPFCPLLRQILKDASNPTLPGGATDPGMVVHSGGCYVAMEGPAFSSRAESLMHRLWGGDLIGMTALPEAKLAREAEIPYALTALVTDYDCWRHKPAEKDKPAADPHELLKEIMGNLKSASESAAGLMKRAVELMNQRREQLSACPAMKALELAIWSDKGRVSPDEVKRLSPLWGKYFSAT